MWHVGNGARRPKTTQEANWSDQTKPLSWTCLQPSPVVGASCPIYEYRKLKGNLFQESIYLELEKWAIRPLLNNPS
jgi:hypothetical protein